MKKKRKDVESTEQGDFLDESCTNDILCQTLQPGI